MSALDLVKLSSLMQLTKGRAEIVVGLIDGPVAISHADLSAEKIREIPGTLRGACARANSVACMHGTFVAGILCAKRDSKAPAICPDCTLVVRPIFAEANSAHERMPSATPEELATAVIECVKAGARIINLSAALAEPSSKHEGKLQEAFDYAARYSAIVVAAAGNQGMLGSSAIIRHSSVIPVAACDLQGRPLGESNLGRSIGRRGLMAPGVAITSLGTNGKPQTLGGTSAAAPFVTGAIALVWSEFPGASAAEIKSAVTGAAPARRRTIAPPLLNAWAAYEAMNSTRARS